MTEVAYIPASAPFSTEQRAWLNGFLAGLLCPGATPPAQPETAPKKPLLILYGSQTGSAERLAKSFAKEAARHSFAARALEANAYTTVDLKTESRLLVVTSTWGEGDPPDNAAQFWSYLNSAGVPDLAHLSFAVLALGDRNYPDFCGAGKKFDERLEQLGAKRIYSRIDCDLDYEAPARTWIESVWKALASVEARGLKVETPALAAAIADKPKELSYSRSRPFAARLFTNRPLTAPDSLKETRHLEISLEGSGLIYDVGDALGIIPSNNPALVQALLEGLGCDGEEEVVGAAGGPTSLGRALLHDYDIAKLTPALVQFVANASGSATLKSFCDAARGADLDQYVAGRDMLDLFRDAAGFRPPPGELVTKLRKLSPRLYSISSSLKAHPNEVHLTVAIVRYELNGRAREGVCSTFLADRVSDKTPLPVFVQPSGHFQLPNDPATPIIMVGPGTGIAPFRAFLEERAAIGATGHGWLFFGDQHAATDFLYREELEAFKAKGILTRLDTAFSRDQAGKVYVQHRMLENAKELWTWLDGGAHFFVCGDGKRMAEDVDAALHDVVVKGGGRTVEQAVEFVAKLKSEKRYKRDVY